jgi:hypothetical protein
LSSSKAVDRHADGEADHPQDAKTSKARNASFDAGGEGVGESLVIMTLQ